MKPLLPGILLACLVISSCGTVHQFIPSQPLEPNEFRATLTYSYDSNLFALGGSWGAGVYAGAGKNTNIGFGYQPPIGISHLTAVKYFKPGNSTNWRIHASANDLFFTFDNSPNFEIGAGVTARKGSAYHTISAGLWTFVSDNTAQPLWMFFFDVPRGSFFETPGDGTGFRPRLRPFVKYDFSNDDYALSLENYIGLTKGIIRYERWRLESRERIVLPADSIESLKFDTRSKRINIVMRNNTEYKITPQNPYIDLILPDFDKMRLERFNPQDEWGYYFVNSGSGPYLYELDFDSIWLGYTAGQTIVLGTFPARKREIFKLIKWYKHDWSLGAGMRIGGKTR